MSIVARILGVADGPPIVPATGWSASLTTLAAVAMCFLAVLTLSAGVAADRLAAAWKADLKGLATVRVSGPADEIDARVERVLHVLATTPGIAKAEPLSPAEHEALLAPWLGAGLDLPELPAPRLIDIDIDGDGPDTERLQARLDGAAPGAFYDDHQSWRGPLSSAAKSLERISWLATALIGVAAAGMVALAARATLAANVDVVRLIRLIGGEDRFIARAFVWRLTMRGFFGGVLGAGMGVAALAGLPELSEQPLLGVSLLPDRMGWLTLIAAVPCASGLIAWLTARISVRMALTRMV